MPSPLNESGVTLITPMTLGRGKRAAIGGLTAALCLAGLGFRRLHCRAGPGQWEGPTERFPLAIRLGLGLGRGLLLGREHLLLGLAGEQPLELIFVDRLALDQDLREPVEVVHVLAEHCER